jgi:methanethiol S-methyltransferase
LVISQHLYLIVLWVLFCIQHSLFATEWWKSKMRKWLGTTFRFYRFYYSVFAAVNLVLLLWLQFSIESKFLWRTSVLFRLIAFLFGCVGLLVMFACIRKYFFGVSGIKAFSAQSDRLYMLQTRGLHGYIRHPLYFGTLLFIWSLFFCFPLLNNLIACSLISIYTVAGIRIEERKLVTEYGEYYKAYARKTPMLIPRIFARRTKLPHTFPGTV